MSSTDSTTEVPRTPFGIARQPKLDRHTHPAHVTEVPKAETDAPETACCAPVAEATGQKAPANSCC